MLSGVLGEMKELSVAYEAGTKSIYKYEVSIDFFSTYILYSERDYYIDYIGKEVEFSVRMDYDSGVPIEVINTLAVKSIVQSVRFDNGEECVSSLIPYSNNVVDVIDFDSNYLSAGAIAQARTILITGYVKGKSKVTRWIDFSCLDNSSKAFNLRLFSNDNNIEDFCENTVCKYVMCDIKNTPWGFQIVGEVIILDQELNYPGEVLLSIVKLESAYKQDEQLTHYIDKYNMIETIKNLIYYEPGYHLVEMAAEVMLIDTICSIFEGYDKEVLYRAVFASRGYLIGSRDGLSNPLVNYHRIITSKLKDDSSLIKLLDFTSAVEEGNLNKQAYLSIRKQVSSIMKGRRGLNEKNSISSLLESIDNEYGGLFRQGIFKLD